MVVREEDEEEDDDDDAEVLGGRGRRRRAALYDEDFDRWPAAVRDGARLVVRKTATASISLQRDGPA
jgi:hypothetical protein